MDRTERFYKIERLLHSHRALSLTRMLEELGVSRATFKRDLEYLRDRFSAPILWDADLRGYRLERKDEGDSFALPGFWLSANEAQALFALEHLIETLEPGLLAQTLAPLKTRLEKLLGDSKSSARELRRRLRLVQPLKRPVSPPHFAIAACAVLNRKQVKLVHHVRERDEITERVVSPQRLTYYKTSWYLDAWCHMRKALRSFALDAVQSAELLEIPAKECSTEEMERVLSTGYGIFGGEAMHTAKLRFNAHAARWASREQWHPKQKGNFDKQGRYVLEVPYADPRELLMDVLRYGADAEVLAPESLRKAAYEHHRNALKHYA